MPMNEEATSGDLDARLRGAEPSRFFFIHLQKTAGTALLRRLRHHFGPTLVYPWRKEQGTPATVLDVDLLLERLDARPEVQVVTGHFPLCVAELIPGPVTTFTLVRDPVERTLSFLRHQREVEPRFAGATLEQIYDDPVTTGGLVINHMVKMLSLTVEEMTAGALTPLDVDDARLARAQQNLAERIDAVGLQEEMETFCSELEARFGWDLGDPVFMNRTAPAPASEALRDRIRADNAPDVALHRCAVELCGHRQDGPSAAPPGAASDARG